MRTRGERGYPALIAAILMFLCPLAVGTNTSAGASTDPNDEPNDLRWDLAKDYEFTWESVQMSSSLWNPANTDRLKSGPPQRTLDISLQVDILNTKEVAGIDAHPVIWEVLDENGRPVSVRLWAPAPQYDPLAWEGKTRDRREWPASLLIRLTFDPNQTVPASLSSLKGYLRFLYGQDEVNADIPYGPGDWIEVLPDLEIRLDEHTLPPAGPLQIEYEYVETPRGRVAIPKYPYPVCEYGYTTYTRSKTGGFVLGLGTWAIWPSGTVFEYAVMWTELMDTKENLHRGVPFEPPWYLPDGTLVCTGRWDQDSHSYDIIRHYIAVKPYEVKVPFVLKDIPVPTFQPVGK